MPTLESLRKRIDNAEDLQSVVITMKSLAAVSIRQYERGAEALDEYNAAVERGLQAILRHAPPDLLQRPPRSRGERLIVAFGSDQGMCGRFNDDLARYLVDDVLGGDPGDWRILGVGERLLNRLADSGAEVVGEFHTASSPSGLAALVQDILVAIEQRRREAPLRDLLLVFNHRASRGSYEPMDVRLLPLDRLWLEERLRQPWPTNQVPALTMPWETLFASFVREYLFVGLSRALIHSLASENASRLASMQAAEKNIEERLDEFVMKYHQERQQSITEEIHDIISGFTALTQQ